MQSLKLDVKVLQQNRDQDRQEFQVTVNKNFADVQKSLLEMQSSLTHLITALHPRDPAPATPLVGQGSVHQITPQAPVKNAQEAVHTPPTVGSGVLHDMETGRELNLDVSNKQPYRHPHYG